VLKTWRRFSWCKMMSRIWHPDDSISMLKRVGIYDVWHLVTLWSFVQWLKLGNEPCWSCDIESVFLSVDLQSLFLCPVSSGRGVVRGTRGQIHVRLDRAKRRYEAHRTGHTFQDWMTMHGMPWHAQKKRKRYTGTTVYKYVYIYIIYSMYIPTLANMDTWIYSIYSMLIQCDVGVNSCTALTCHHKKEDCCVREPHGRSLASANQNRRPLCQRAQFRWTGEIMVSWQLG
jgi:hypothetical protein